MHDRTQKNEPFRNFTGGTHQVPSFKTQWISKGFTILKNNLP